MTDATTHNPSEPACVCCGTRIDLSRVNALCPSCGTPVLVTVRRWSAMPPVVRTLATATPGFVGAFLVVAGWVLTFAWRGGAGTMRDLWYFIASFLFVMIGAFLLSEMPFNARRTPRSKAVWLAAYALSIASVVLFVVLY